MQTEEITRDDLEDLVRWLAVTYAGDPVFICDDEPPVRGANPEVRRRLKATWDAVIGHKGPPVSGTWIQCVTCAGIGWLVGDANLLGSDLELDLLTLVARLEQVDAEGRPDHFVWDRIIGADVARMRNKWISPQAQATARQWEAQDG